MRRVIAAPEARLREESLIQLVPLHQASIEAMLRVMSPEPVFVRLLAQSLEDFLPPLQQIDLCLADARSDEDWDEMLILMSMRRQHAVGALVNPSLGNRGYRLRHNHPEVVVMQVTSILQAALALKQKGVLSEPCIVIPLVASEEEVRVVVKDIRDTAHEVFERARGSVRYRVGALIELPRAAICAAAISKLVDFVCFGTNDLTQMTYGFAKQDLSAYIDSHPEQGSFTQDPFVTLDLEGVGHLLSAAIRSIRKFDPGMELGVCGDHTEDERSLEFFCSLGISFVSCEISSFREVSRTVDKLACEAKPAA